MYVVALPNGKYKFCEQYVDNLTNKRREVSVTLDKDNRVTRSNAQKVLLSKISKNNTTLIKILLLSHSGNLWTSVKESLKNK